jgi:hypothetical protein
MPEESSSGFLGSWLGYGSTAANSLTVPSDAIGTFRGSWLSHLDFVPRPCAQAEDTGEAERLWTYDEVGAVQFESVPQERRLPSDCSFRKDVRLLAEGDVAGAGAAKQRVEDQQRRERKLRCKH